MIKRYTIELTIGQASVLPRYVAYPLYGYLMSRIPTDYAQCLHEQRPTPLSQWVKPTQNGYIWTISLFGEDAILHFGSVLDGLTQFMLEKPACTLAVAKCISEPVVSYQELILQGQEAPIFSRQNIGFQSPAGYKSQKEYVLYPTSDLFLKSLLQRWNGFCNQYPLEDADMVQLLLNQVRISGYRLNSCAYPLKGQYIPAFTGSIQLTAHCSPPIAPIYHTLLAFGTYAGSGIKTTLGMGAYKLL